MRKPLNTCTYEGYVYDVSKLNKKVCQKQGDNFGKEFINGELKIAIAGDELNIVSVHYTFVTATTKAGKTNSNFAVLSEIIDHPELAMINNDDESTYIKVKATPAIDLNDFIVDENGEERWVNAKRNEGGFISKVKAFSKDMKDRNKFEADMLLNGFRLVEADGESIKEDYAVVKGAIFSFAKRILPVEFIVRNPEGIAYFESFDLSGSNLQFKKVRGSLVSQTVVKETEEKGGFGETLVKSSTRTTREWVLNWASDESYDLDDEENGITMEEIKEKLAEREIYLADVKKRNEEYQASRQSATPAPAAPQSAPVAQGGFAF